VSNTCNSCIHTSRETDAALKGVSEERTVYLGLLDEARGAIAHLQDELTDARYTILSQHACTGYSALVSLH
jgi:hypothetical protein